MAICCSDDEDGATFGITRTLEPSIQIFQMNTNGVNSGFTATGWIYTGPNAAEKGIFYIGEDETPFTGGSNARVWVGTGSDGQTLTLSVYDGSSETEVTGSSMSLDTWYRWAYTKNRVTGEHVVYLGADAGYNTPMSADIAQVITDGFGPGNTTTRGIFFFCPPGTRICALKMWSQRQTTFDTLSTQWFISLAGNTQHCAQFRFPNDLYNYTGTSSGGRAHDDPASDHNTTHLRNIDSTSLAYAPDPATLLLSFQLCQTMLQPDSYDVVTDDPGPSTPLTRDHTEYRHVIKPDTAWPIGSTLQYIGYAIESYYDSTTGGVSGTSLFTIGAEISDPSGTVSGFSATSGSGNYSYQISSLLNGTDPVTSEAWNTLDHAEARRRILAYYFGYRAVWSGSPAQGTDPRILRTRALRLIITYSLPTDWDYCSCAPHPEFGGGRGHSGGVLSEGDNMAAALPAWTSYCALGGTVPTGTNGTDAESWA
jgi:hypothetical protein